MHKTSVINKWSCTIFIVLPFLMAGGETAQKPNEIINGDFEIQPVRGTIPNGWKAWDENAGYERWIACRSEQILAGVLPYHGEWMAAIDTDRMGVNTNGEDFGTVRAALYQTLEMPRGIRGVFRIRYNDLGSTSGAWVSGIRLGCTIDSEDLNDLAIPETGKTPAWTRLYYKAAIENGGTGDWMTATLPVEVPPGEGNARVTLWIGIFDNSSGTEVGYWRVDDARFERE